MCAAPAPAAERRRGSNPGWSDRILRRTGASVGVGAVAGTGYALLRNEPALVTARNTGASCGIVALTFCSLQELCRLLRQADGPENSLLARPSRAWLRIAAPTLTHAPVAQAGAASGALLRGVHHGKAFALPGAIAAGTVAYLAHRALDAHAAGSFSGPLEAMSNADVWAWLPIKRISDQEVAEREAAFAARVARATGGTVGDEAGPLAKREPLERARTKSARDGKA